MKQDINKISPGKVILLVFKLQIQIKGDDIQLSQFKYNNK